jgi:hypothetical protein
MPEFDENGKRRFWSRDGRINLSNDTFVPWGLPSIERPEMNEVTDFSSEMPDPS